MKDFQGILFLITGNSGSGKDSIISGVINKFPSNKKQIYAPKRYITREASEFEKNITITPETFRIMEKKGKFALSWQIYGLSYGIPIEIEDYLAKGHHVIINVSRNIIKQAREKYKNIKVVFIEVPFEITLRRIENRKRESKVSLKARIERAKENQKFTEADFTIDNSGKLDDAINKFFIYLIKFVKNE